MNRCIDSMFIAKRECPEALLRVCGRKILCNNIPRCLQLGYVILFMFIASVLLLHCTGHKSRQTPPVDKGAAAFNDVDIEKKYLAEGFISNETFRVVIVSLKDKDAAPIETITSKAKSRAIVSLERILIANHINPDRSTRAEIIGLIETNGLLYRKDLEHKRYDVYYFEITKKNLKGYMRNISSGR